MNEIISQITPLTRGMIWLVQEEWDQQSSVYLAIDYLTNGLLTSTLIDSPIRESQILVGKNFGIPFFVLITRDLSSSTFQNFKTLFEQDLNVDNDVLIVHSNKEISDVLQLVSEEFKDKTRFLKN